MVISAPIGIKKKLTEGRVKDQLKEELCKKNGDAMHYE
jgi:hypothetical protein